LVGQTLADVRREARLRGSERRWCPAGVSGSNAQWYYAVAKISDWFDPLAWGAPERRFNGSALSEVRESPRSVAIQ